MIMNRADALKQLGKLLGKSFGYRVDSDAPNAEEREAARAALAIASEKAKALLEQKEARIKALLDADAEYQQIKADHEAAKKARNKLAGICHQYKFTVGTSSELFFHVKAQGDSWEEVIAKVKAK